MRGDVLRERALERRGDAGEVVDDDEADDRERHRAGRGELALAAATTGRRGLAEDDQLAHRRRHRDGERGPAAMVSAARHANDAQRDRGPVGKLGQAEPVGQADLPDDIAVEEERLERADAELRSQWSATEGGNEP